MKHHLPRLTIAELSNQDLPFFTELVTDPDIINPVPHAAWSEEEINDRFNEFTDYSKNPRDKTRVVWGIYEKGSSELIGLCALLTNDEDQPELGYRLRKPYWGKGYATEVSAYLIEYCFKTLNLELLSADANIANPASIKILEKFFSPVRDFFNAKENCWDRRFILYRSDWLNNS